MNTLIFHSLAMRKVQTLSVVLTVTLSVMTLFALGLVYGGVTTGVQANAERSGARIMAVPHDAAAGISDTSLLFTGSPAPIYLPKGIESDIAETEGVARTTSQFFSQTLDASCCSTIGNTRLIGVDFSSDWTIQPFATFDVSAGLSSSEVIIGSAVGGEVGSEMAILGSFYTIVEKLAPSGSDLDNSLLLDIDVARAASQTTEGLGYLWEANGNPNELVSCILLDIDEKAEASRVLNRLSVIEGVTTIERSTVVETAQRELESVFLILLGVGLVMLVTTLVQLFARFYSCVWERKSELALYRAIGASKTQLRRMIGGEVGLIVSAGLALGLACGIGLYELLLNMLQKTASFPFIGLGGLEIAGLVAAIVVIFAAIAAIAIIAPLAQIARLDPSLAMQQGDID